MSRIKLADYGRTVCQGCDGSLNDGQPTTLIDSIESYHVRRGGNFYRRERPVKRRIHTECLRKSEEDRQARMQASKLESLTGLWEGMRDSGKPESEIIAMMLRAGVTDDEIEQIKAATR
jgi:hypothetical protein